MKTCVAEAGEAAAITSSAHAVNAARIAAPIRFI
jgi:hypothetical protein